MNTDEKLLLNKKKTSPSNLLEGLVLLLPAIQFILN